MRSLKYCEAREASRREGDLGNLGGSEGYRKGHTAAIRRGDKFWPVHTHGLFRWEWHGRRAVARMHRGHHVRAGVPAAGRHARGAGRQRDACAHWPPPRTKNRGPLCPARSSGVTAEWAGRVLHQQARYDTARLQRTRTARRGGPWAALGSSLLQGPAGRAAMRLAPCECGIAHRGVCHDNGRTSNGRIALARHCPARRCGRFSG